MARFKIMQRVTGRRGPSWAQLVEWATLGKSVELVVVDYEDGTSAVEVRRWTRHRDDTDDTGVRSNRPEAKPGTEYACPCGEAGTGDAGGAAS